MTVVADTDFEGPFGAESSSVGEWADRVLETADARVRAGTPATVLAHPSCMWLADGFGGFERLCDELSSDTLGSVELMDHLPVEATDA